MDQLPVLLLLTLLAAGIQSSGACGEAELGHGSSRHSRLCYACSGVGNYCLRKPVMCPSGLSQCMSSTIVLEIGGSSLKIKEKVCVDDCRNGSMNSGVTKTAFSCCGTDFCNAEDAPDPRLSAPTGRKCYYCDGQSCRNTVSCAGTEDGCITMTVINRGTPTLLKGCITKSVCGLLKCSFIQDLSCCEGDLCNGDKGLTPGAIYNADKSLNLSAVQSFTYKGDTQRAMNEGAKKSDTQRAMNEGAKSDTQRAMNEGAKSDTQSAMNEGAKKSDTQRAPYNGAKSVTHSFLFSVLLLPAALILQ